MKSSIIGKTFTLSKPVVDHVIVLHAARSSSEKVTETVIFGWCMEIKGFIVRIVHGGFPFSGKTTISVIGAQDMVINLDIFFRVACAVLKTMKIFLAVSNQRHIRVFLFVSSRVKLFTAMCPGKMSDADRGLGIKDVRESSGHPFHYVPFLYGLRSRLRFTTGFKLSFSISFISSFFLLIII